MEIHHSFGGETSPGARVRARQVNGRSFHVGSFELVSVSELRARLGGP